MRRFIILMCVIFLPLVSMGQENAPRAMVFGGYSYFRSHKNGFNGWETQGTFNLNRYLGITADVSGNNRTLASLPIPVITPAVSQRFSEYLFGPTVTAGFGRSTLFAHTLFGVVHSSLAAGVTAPIIGGVSMPITSATAFAMAFGGGLDIGLTKHFAIRAAQVDYIRSQFSSLDALAGGLSASTGNRQNSFRYSAGIVFRF